MKLRIPPAVLFLLALGFTILCYFLVPDLNYRFGLGVLVSRIFLALGAFLGIIAVWTFKKNRTTVDPLHPEKTTFLVETGVYAYTRNPMYLAMALVLLGAIIRFANPVGALSLPFYVWYLTRFQIIPEEKVMLRLFGVTYQRYCSKVRRWI